jgi:hypothetical protein
MAYEEPGPGPGQSGSTTEVAKEQAGRVGQTAAQSAGQVAQTTKEQAQNVVGEAKQQARDLVGEARMQVRNQAGSQKERAVQGLRSLGDELEQMASQGGQSGLAAEVARQVSSRTHDLASYLDRHEPADLLEEARAYARRRPVVFLAGAALAGVVAGRMTKGIAASSGGSGNGQRQLTGYAPAELTTAQPLTDQPAESYGTSGVASPVYPGTGYESTGYETVGSGGTTTGGGFGAPDAGPMGSGYGGGYADQGEGGTYPPVGEPGAGYDPTLDPDQPPARGWNQ